MKFTQKEAVIWDHYKSLLETNLFDEYDILGLFIFIRRHLDKNRYKYIYHCSDLVAHRKRNQGIVMDCICAMIDNNYTVEDGSKAVKGYHGITYESWENEWLDFGTEFSVNLSVAAISDLIICIFSLMQGTEYDNTRHRGKIELFQDAKSRLSLCTTEGHSDSYYVCFSQSAPVTFQTKFPAGHIHQPVETYRDFGVLHLRTLDGKIIL